jgi:hypothetical protein
VSYLKLNYTNILNELWLNNWILFGKLKNDIYLCIVIILIFKFMDAAPKIAIIENKLERINEFKNLIKQVGYEGEVMFFDNAQELMNAFNFDIYNLSHLPELIFVNITAPVINGVSFFIEFESFSEIVKQNCHVITYSSNIQDAFFIANDYNYQPIEFNNSFSELFDGFILSDSVKCFA